MHNYRSDIEFIETCAVKYSQIRQSSIFRHHAPNVPSSTVKFLKPMSRINAAPFSPLLMALMKQTP